MDLTPGLQRMIDGEMAKLPVMYRITGVAATRTELQAAPVQAADLAGMFMAAYRAGREDAARAVERHADEFAPSAGNAQQRQMRRHLLIAARVARPTPTVEEIAEAVRRGDYAACYLDEAGQPVAEKG